MTASSEWGRVDADGTVWVRTASGERAVGSWHAGSPEEGATSAQWESTGDRFRAIVEEWKAIRGVDRKTDEALWKRFAAARDTFTQRRGTHFASLDAQRSQARARKEVLVAEAEELAE